MVKADLLAKLIGELDDGDDVLSQLNALELLGGGMAAGPGHSVALLRSLGLPQRLEKMMLACKVMTDMEVSL